jgi:ProP effector
MKPKHSEIIQTLAELFPNVFVAERWDTHRPLKIGIRDDLVARGIIQPDEAKAIGVYTGRRMYQQALAEGGARFDLDGNECGAVSDEQAAVAKAHLDLIDDAAAAAAKQARQAAIEERRKSRPPRVWRVLPDSPPEPRCEPAAQETPASAPDVLPAPQRLSLAGLKAAAQAQPQPWRGLSRVVMFRPSVG